MNSILFVEDDAAIGFIVTETLNRSGYFVTHISDGQKALEIIQDQSFDAYILDIMLPKVSGFSLAEQIRKLHVNIPILFLTAKTTKEDLIKAYQLGANDFLRKPFHIEELLLRLKQLLQKNALYQIGAYTFNAVRQELIFQNQIEKLSHRETHLLKILVSNQGQITDRKAVLLEIWGNDDFFSARNMDAYISKLRKKLSQDPKISILNMRGFGYKLIS